MEENHTVDSKENLQDLKMPVFMMSNVYVHLTDPEQVLFVIGITPNSLEQSQIACLVHLPLHAVFACFQLFVQWVDQGVYDFCNLPLALKAHLPEADRVFLEQELKDQWKGELEELETEVKRTIELLKHSEGDILKRVNEQNSRVRSQCIPTMYAPPFIISNWM